MSVQELTERKALSPRELEVIRLIAQGCTDAQTADHLHLSRFTVKTMVQNILRKLGARNRAHAIAIYYEVEWWRI